jgi:cytoskeletal protein CcmA (bactofilin family)
MHLEGAFSGVITSPDGTLRVSELSEIDASIDVAIAQIHGTVKGDVSARDRIVLKRTAILRGDIQTPTLIIEEGAIFEGRCRMSKEPSAQQAVRRKLRQVALQT